LWGSINGWRWDSVAVPSRREGNGRGPAGVLRIGFPEWTLWALPLVQHEIGLVALRTGRTAADPDALAVRRADAAAALITGPAYAYAMFAFRLNASEVTDEHSLDGQRAATIIAALRHAGEAAGSAEVGALASRLAAAWADAVEGAGGRREVAEQLDGENESHAIAEKVGGQLKGAPATTAYAWAHSWPSMLAWAATLWDEQVTELDINASPTTPAATIALLMNAAWQYRISLPDDGAGEDDHAEQARYQLLDDVAAKTVKLCLGVARQLDGSTGGGRVNAVSR
jgi:hypothetical protein